MIFVFKKMKVWKAERHKYVGKGPQQAEKSLLRDIWRTSFMAEDRILSEN